VFTLPVSHEDYQRDVNLTDTLHALQRLDDTTNSVFARMLTRIQVEVDRTRKLVFDPILTFYRLSSAPHLLFRIQ